MKKLIVIGLILILLMGVKVSAGILYEDVVSDEIQRTLGIDDNYSISINKIRKEVGLESLIISDTLKKMALAHSKYMYYNNIITSIEEKELVYYRGRYPWDRGDYFQYELDFVYEFVAKDNSSYMEGYMDLLNDPISRYVILNPKYKEVGMGTMGNYITYEFGGNKETMNRILTYPYNGQENVDKAWTGQTLDSLKRDSIIDEDKVGLPITFMYYGKDVDSITNPYIVFKDIKNNESVDFTLILPGDFHKLKNAMTIVPLHPYNNTKYQVTMNFDLNFKNGDTEHINKTIYFSTNLIEESLESPYITRAGFIQKIINNQYLDFTLIEPLELKFSDVDLQSNESIYIYTANQEGLINGYPDGKFRPEFNITKEQVYKILVEAYERKNPEIVGQDIDELMQYRDKEYISNWAYPYLLKAKALSILIQENGLLKPNEYVTEIELEEIMVLYNQSIQK